MAESAATNAHRIRRAAGNVVLCLGALMAACLAIHRIAPLPDIPEVSAKLAYFDRHRDEFDTVFVGSSRVYRGIMPGIFDAAAPTKSFNLGIDGMMAPESYFLLEKILAKKPARLKWIFVELTSLQSQIDMGRSSTMRDVYWHDWPRTVAMCRNIFITRAGRIGLRKKGRLAIFQKNCELAALHLQLFLKNCANVGRGAELFCGTPGVSPDVLDAVFGPPLSGFAQMAGRRVSLSGADLERYEKMRASAVSAKTRQDGRNAAFQQATARAVARVRSAGAVPLFVITPWPDVPRVFFPDKKSAPAVFSFNDPAGFPELFRADRHVDAGHLNRRGAEEFTQLLAARFTQFLIVPNPSSN